jgi:hypothetical protein
VNTQPMTNQERITEDIAERQTNEEEARWPICPECLESLDDENGYKIVCGCECPNCGLEFGVKSTEEVKPIEQPIIKSVTSPCK